MARGRGIKGEGSDCYGAAGQPQSQRRSRDGRTATSRLTAADHLRIGRMPLVRFDEARIVTTKFTKSAKRKDQNASLGPSRVANSGNGGG